MRKSGPKPSRVGAAWAAVLCGGSGSRLWPLSTLEKPKPFHAMCSEQSLLTDTLQRLSSIDRSNTLLVGQMDHADHLLCEATQSNLPLSNILLEPQMRNTAASVCLAALAVEQIDGEATLIVTPSDHFVEDDALFKKALDRAVALAQDESLVLLGSPASSPSTDYGYIVPEPREHGVAEFVEKPDHLSAIELVKKGAMWNCGIFVFKVSSMLAHLRLSQPELVKTVSNALNAAKNVGAGIEIHSLYCDAASRPFDKTVVETYPNIKVLPLNTKWNDVGSWSALHRSSKDERGNLFIGMIEQTGTNNCLVHSTDVPVKIENLEGVAIIATQNQILAKALPNPNPRVAAKQTINRAARIRHWLEQEVLSFWLERGVASDGLSFVEEINLDGSSSDALPSLSTIARQVTAFSRLSLLTNNFEAKRLARQGAQSLSVLSSFENASAYALSQCLLACVAHYPIDPKVSQTFANETLTALENLELQNGDGFSHNLQQRKTVADADSHMHIVNVAQAWMRCSGDTRAKALASQGWAAFFHYFFDEKNWRVSEVADHAHKAGPWSPGHHFEWARLWVEGDAKDQIVEDFSFAQQLWATATAYGATDTNGLLSLLVDGTGPGDAETRAWVIAEQLRAAIALKRPQTEIERICDALFEFHIDPAPSGLWYDRLETKHATCMSPSVRASVLHHIVLALEAYLVWSDAEDKATPEIVMV